MPWNSRTRRLDEVETHSSGMPGAVVGTVPTLPPIPQFITYTTPASTDTSSSVHVSASIKE